MRARTFREMGEMLRRAHLSPSDFFDAIEKVRKNSHSKPHTCPTCDGYGYLRWNGEYAGWSKVDQTSSDALHKDIPCPDCNV